MLRVSAYHCGVIGFLATRCSPGDACPFLGPEKSSDVRGIQKPWLAAAAWYLDPDVVDEAALKDSWRVVPSMKIATAASNCHRLILSFFKISIWCAALSCSATEKMKNWKSSANKLVWHIISPSGLPDTCPPGHWGGGGVWVCVRVGRGRDGGGGGLPQSAFTKPADLTFVRPGPAVRCQALLCDWSPCAVDLGSALVPCDWLLISPQLPVRPDEVLSPSGSRPPLPLQLWDDLIPTGIFTARIRQLSSPNRFKSR